MKVRVGDNVVVLTGSDRGKTAIITKLLQKQDRVVVEGINKRIKHVKGRDGQPGERVEFFAPIHVSNVAIADPKTGKPSKIGYKKDNKEKTRIARASGEPIPSVKSDKK